MSGGRAPTAADALVVSPGEGRHLEMGPNAVTYKLEGEGPAFAVGEFDVDPGLVRAPKHRSTAQSNWPYTVSKAIHCRHHP